MKRRSFFATLLAPLLARFQTGAPVPTSYAYMDEGHTFYVIQQELSLEEFCRRYPPSVEWATRNTPINRIP